jgi:glycine/D-amino acid oxidase-like deaminating enzyme
MTCPEYVVLGAGVVGLTTALELQARYSSSTTAVVAKFLPGDSSVEYTSPWAGANWSSVATDNGVQESWDEITYHKFGDLADHVPEAGVRRMELRSLFDSRMEDAGVLSEGTGKVWFEKLVGGLRMVSEEELKKTGAVFGWDWNSFVIDVQKYLPW